MNTSVWNSDRFLSASEHHELREKIQKTLMQGNNLTVVLPHEFREKDRFDCIRLACSTENIDIVGLVRDLFSVSRFAHETNTICFKVDGIKVELYIVKGDELDFAQSYLSYGIAGSIPGKLLHRMGMKISVRGLHYLIRDQMFDGDSVSGHILEEVPLTTSWEMAMSLLSVDGRAWYNLANQDELFSYVASSKEFCPSVFYAAMEAKTESFLEKLADADIFITFCQWLQAQAWPEKGFRRRKVYRKGLYSIFPVLKNRMFANSGKVLRRKEIVRKINPTLIRQWLALEESDPAPYNVLKIFKERCDELEVLALSQDEIRAMVVSIYHYLQQVKDA